MKNTFGNNISVTLFGESHGPAVGAVLDGLAPGMTVDESVIAQRLSLRRPQGDVSTARSEKDPFVIESGVYNGKTTGTPLCILIPNGDARPSDYEDMRFLPRPGHADYTGHIKYRGFEDPNGGGHFSGRITAALCAAAAVLIPALEAKGIYTGSHIYRCAGVSDVPFSGSAEEIKKLNAKYFAVLDESAGEKMREKILAAASGGDSVGGIVETAITGLPAGIGEPWFDTVEGVLAHALFSVPAVKGVEFGAGFALADMRGSEANDPFVIKDGEIKTVSNNSGGVLGGITTGMPVLFRTVIKPTPTLRLPQDTVDLEKNENAVLAAKGRHDPCIVHRARAVIDSVAVIAVSDLLSTHFGADWLSL